MSDPNQELLGSLLVTMSGMHGELIALGKQMTSLVGNGQPGRIALLEQKIETQGEQIQRWRGAVGVLTFLLLLLSGTEVWHILLR